MPDEGTPSSLSTLGARIREIRGEQGITLAELSARAQVSVAMLSHLERGQAAPSLKTLDRLRLALDVPLTAFFQPDESEGSRTVVVRKDRRARLPQLAAEVGRFVAGDGAGHAENDVAAGQRQARRGGGFHGPTALRGGEPGGRR